MKKILIALLTIISLNCQGQKTEKYNLGFENQNEEKILSDGWFKWGNYELTIDEVAHSGKKSGKITSDQTGSSFGCIVYKDRKSVVWGKSVDRECGDGAREVRCGVNA